MRIILDRTPQGYWTIEMPGGSPGIPLCLDNSVKAGDAAAYVARCNPRAKIGIRSKAIGPEVELAYGAVLWLKDEWTERARASDPGDVHGEQ